MRCPKCKGEEIGFSRIERLLGVSHTAVIYWVKKAGEKIKDIRFWRKKSREKSRKKQRK